jgi:hypothetical protein
VIAGFFECQNLAGCELIDRLCHAPAPGGKIAFRLGGRFLYPLCTPGHSTASSREPQ